MKKLKKVSRNDLKSVFGGSSINEGLIKEVGPKPMCGGQEVSYSVYMGERCTCGRLGGTWACGECVTGNDRILLALANTCDQFHNWPS